jgi:hypothetical protein
MWDWRALPILDDRSDNYLELWIALELPITSIADKLRLGCCFERFLPSR